MKKDTNTVLKSIKPKIFYDRVIDLIHELYDKSNIENSYDISERVNYRENNVEYILSNVKNIHKLTQNDFYSICDLISNSCFEDEPGEYTLLSKNFECGLSTTIIYEEEKQENNIINCIYSIIVNSDDDLLEFNIEEYPNISEEPYIIRYAKEYYNALLKEGLITEPKSEFETMALYYFIQGFKSYNNILEQMEILKERQK